MALEFFDVLVRINTENKAILLEKWVSFLRQIRELCNPTCFRFLPWLPGSSELNVMISLIIVSPDDLLFFYHCLFNLLVLLFCVLVCVF